jgi:hypothetical protein
MWPWVMLIVDLGQVGLCIAREGLADILSLPISRIERCYARLVRLMVNLSRAGELLADFLTTPTHIGNYR